MPSLHKKNSYTPVRFISLLFNIIFPKELKEESCNSQTCSEHINHRNLPKNTNKYYSIKVSDHRFAR